jgi:glycosyltransferase involved in cell wall biosynthesis
MTVPVTIIIHTKNEETNLPKALANVAGWADQIVVVDSESVDRTSKIADEFGVELISRPCTRAQLVQQRNWALDTISFRNDWAFVLDADETIDAELKTEIENIVRSNDPGKDGYSCRSKLIFLGRWIRRATIYETWTLRLLRHSVVRYERREVNARPVVAPKREGRMLGNLRNEDLKGLKAYLVRIDEFSRLEGVAYSRIRDGIKTDEKGRLFGSWAQRRRYFKNVFMNFPMRPFVLFVYLYIVRGGFLDGKPGLYFVVLRVYMEFLIDMTRYEAEVVSSGREP